MNAKIINFKMITLIIVWLVSLRIYTKDVISMQIMIANMAN